MRKILKEMSEEEYLEHRRKIIRESQRRRREKARKEGICTVCVKRPARKGKITCEICGKIALEAARRKRAVKEAVYGEQRGEGKEG